MSLLALAISAGAGQSVAAADSGFDPDTHPDVREMLDSLAQQGLPADKLVATMRQAQLRPQVLDAMSHAAERRLRWDEYRDIFIQPARIRQGVAFLRAHREALARAQREYGVAPEVIVAILGVETQYGRHKGTHRVLDSLSTLAFHHPSRGAFFRGELEAFLQITLGQGVDPTTEVGSYAGAMGYPQFIPTSYQAYAVDFDGDGIKDLWNDPVDAIGSVANYFAKHGWQPDRAVLVEARGPHEPPSSIAFNRTEPPDTSVQALADVGIVPTAGDLEPTDDVTPLALDFADGHVRYVLGLKNFYVITRYNHSHLYAMAVATLAQRIQTAMEGTS
ncbi:lytic murein transglycosylase B [Salinicola rhizosphaerae]|uniref:Soluble lytic transglycosylase B n=1 Tax=Salinicola rhizosphaerae TaxID=1443141 RepID=A0ABQ3DSD7_9GAMM|nr:lytic murein transglycosylase B [Salinicola rhizosphaerae]GHB10842.1 soluble lytic transglycosylase B [Salinicola rhizosphaerae]